MMASAAMPSRPASPVLTSCLPSRWGRCLSSPLPPASYTHQVLSHETCSQGQARTPKQVSPRIGASARGLAVMHQTMEFSQTGKNCSMVACLRILESSRPGGSSLPSPSYKLSDSGQVI